MDLKEIPSKARDLIKVKNVSVNTDTLLEEMNNDKASLMTPVIVLMVILMVMGILGNFLVCYYYGCKAKETSNTVFIVVVAIYDLVLCTLSIPIEIVDLRFFFTFTNRGACKVMRFVNYFGAIGSVYTLIVIAVDRYRKVCKPFKNQIGPKGAKIASATSVLVAMLFSWPAIIFFDAVHVDIPTEDGLQLNGSDCTTIRDSSYRIYLWVFHGIYLVCFLVSTAVLSVLYGLVGSALYRHRKKRERYRSRLNTLNSNRQGTQLAELKGETYRKVTDEHTETKTDTQEPPTRQRSDSQAHIDLKTVKYTMMMLVITIVFVVSFLPYLILSIWRVFIDQYEAESLSDTGLVFFQIGLRSYFINSVANPFTYGFFNPKFRLFFKKTIFPCCIKDKEDRSLSTSSTAD